MLLAAGKSGVEGNPPFDNWILNLEIKQKNKNIVVLLSVIFRSFQNILKYFIIVAGS